MKCGRYEKNEKESSDEYNTEGNIRQHIDSLEILQAVKSSRKSLWVDISSFFCEDFVKP